MGKSQKLSAVEIITELAIFAGCLNILRAPFGLPGALQIFVRFIGRVNHRRRLFTRARGAQDRYCEVRGRGRAMPVAKLHHSVTIRERSDTVPDRAHYAQGERARDVNKPIQQFR